jgi:glycosyl hydrolase family 64 (putative beta-1,3-glucanase)/carbohydrate binding protein with CBM56 domain
MDHKDVNATTTRRKLPMYRAAVLITCSCMLMLCATLAFVSLGGTQKAHAAASGTFSQGVTSVSSSQALFWFQPNGWTAGYVILHYLQPGVPQQNLNMVYNGGTVRWEYTAGGMSAGQVITYSFTYQQAGLQYDSNSYTFTFGSNGGGATPTPTPTSAPGNPTPTATPISGGTGTIPLTLQNNTRGTWTNSQVYVLILGQATPGQWSYLKPDGTLAHINHLDANAPNHLTKNGVNYANMSFTLAQASTVTLPVRLEGARMYISLGSPLYIPIASDDSGWGGPNLLNPSDPNTNVYFDWYEFTYQYGVTPFGGNTTQVDQFSFPLTARVQQTAIGFDQTNGITLTRAQVFSQYTSAVSSPFQPLANTYRIVAPRSSAAFLPGGSEANYMQTYIDQTWNYYTSNQFTLIRGGVTFSGKVVNGQLQFTRNGVGPFVLNKPTTSDVVQCSGALASAGMTTQALELGAEFCAAFNRGVALNTTNWYSPTTYYTGSIKNDYAMFWHQISINNKAYGFAYDDVNSQSSVAILPNANPPSSLTIGIGW